MNCKLHKDPVSAAPAPPDYPITFNHLMELMRFEGTPYVTVKGVSGRFVGQFREDATGRRFTVFIDTGNGIKKVYVKTAA
jgi:hypothetical protein